MAIKTSLKSKYQALSEFNIFSYKSQYIWVLVLNEY